MKRDRNDAGTEQANSSTTEQQQTTVERSIEDEKIEPGATTTVHLKISIANESSFVALHEDFSPAVQSVELVSLPSAGDEWESAGTTEALSVFYDADGVSVLDAGSQVELTYELTVTDEPAQHRVTGELALIESQEFENETWITTEGDAITVGEGIEPYTGGDGIVQTSGLRAAIEDWRAGEINTSLLRDVIDAWRSGEPIGRE